MKETSSFAYVLCVAVNGDMTRTTSLEEAVMMGREVCNLVIGTVSKFGFRFVLDSASCQPVTTQPNNNRRTRKSC